MMKSTISKIIFMVTFLISVFVDLYNPFFRILNYIFVKLCLYKNLSLCWSLYLFRKMFYVYLQHWILDIGNNEQLKENKTKSLNKFLRWLYLVCLELCSIPAFSIVTFFSMSGAICSSLWCFFALNLSHRYQP